MGQTFYVSSVVFGTLVYEKIEPTRRDDVGSGLYLEHLEVNAKLVRAEVVGVLDDFANFDHGQAVEVELIPELEVDG